MINSSFALNLNFNISEDFPYTMKARVLEAQVMIEQVLQNRDFWKQLDEVQDFTCLESPYETTQKAREFIENINIEINVNSYWYFKKKVIAKTVAGVIYLNRKNKYRTSIAWANTLFHEAMHAAGIGHCGLNDIARYPYIKESIPYKLGSIIEEIISQSN